MRVGVLIGGLRFRAYLARLRSGLVISRGLGELNIAELALVFDFRLSPFHWR